MIIPIDTAHDCFRDATLFRPLVSDLWIELWLGGVNSNRVPLLMLSCLRPVCIAAVFG